MDIRAEILKERSKQQSAKIAAYVARHPARLDDLLHIFLHDDQDIVRHAAWILSIVAEQHMDLIQPHLAAMVGRMHEPDMHVAVKRNVVRILQHAEIPEELHAPVMNTCFDFLADPQETVAVRCFSMTVLDRLSKIYPDIRQELITIIEDQLEHEPTAGFRSRARKVLGRQSK